MKFDLGTSPGHAYALQMDLDRLVESRLLIQANSGAGKSWALRRLLEKTYGHVQQIVLDVEDEFHCVAPETPIVLANGSLIQACELKKGDAVISLNENSGQYESCRVTKISKQIVDEVWELSAALSRSLRATANHKLLVRSSRGSRKWGWMRVCEIKKGDYIAIPDHVPVLERMAWKWQCPKWTRKVDGRLYYRAPSQDSPYRSSIRLPKLNDPRLYKFLGCFLADGHLSKTLSVVHFVDGKRSNREAFSKLAKELFEIEVAPKDHAKKYETWIRNKTLGVFLASLGCQAGRKAKTLLLPPLVMQSPTSLSAAFVKAYQACDGSGKSMVTASSVAAIQLAYLIERTGIHAAIYRKEQRHTTYVENAVLFQINPITEDSNHGHYSTKYALGAKEREAGKDGRMCGLHWVKVKKNVCVCTPTEVIGCYVPPHNNLILGKVPLISHNTLREKYDYVLAGRQGGDCPATPQCAALLARRLLELRVSAIIGIYELKAHERQRFVRFFLEALIDSPRSLWHPCLVIVDEAHFFCPESGRQHGHTESSGAVIDLMTRGRKRGLCGVLATQRISKLHKDAAAEANNKLIGRSALDVDMKRAADEIGFTTREQQHSLRALKPGEFFAFGPAISDEVRRILIGPVKTTHPKAGQRVVMPVPPSHKIKNVLAKLADLPKEADDEVRTTQELRKKIKDLEAALRQQPKPQVIVQKARLDAQALRPYQERENVLRKAVDEATHKLEKISKLGQQLLEQTRSIPDVKLMLGNVPALKPLPSPLLDSEKLPAGTKSRGAVVTSDGRWHKTESSNGSEKLAKVERAMLSVLAQHGACEKPKLAILSGYSARSSSFHNALSSLSSKNFIQRGPRI